MKTSQPKCLDWLPSPCLSSSPALVSPLTWPFPIRPGCTRAHLLAPEKHRPGRRPGPSRSLLPGLLPPFPATRGPMTRLAARSPQRVVWQPSPGLPASTAPTGPWGASSGASCGERWRRTSRAETRWEWDGPPGRGHSGTEEAAGGAEKQEDWESWCGLPMEVRGSEKAPPHSLEEHSTMHRLLENVPDGGGERAEAESG